MCHLLLSINRLTGPYNERLSKCAIHQSLIMDVLQICARFFIPVFIVKSLHAAAIKINLLGCQKVPFINDLTEVDTF